MTPLCCDCRKPAAYYTEAEAENIYQRRVVVRLHYCPRCRPLFAIPLSPDEEQPQWTDSPKP